MGARWCKRGRWRTVAYPPRTSQPRGTRRVTPGTDVSYVAAKKLGLGRGCHMLGQGSRHVGGLPA